MNNQQKTSIEIFATNPELSFPDTDFLQDIVLSSPSGHSDVILMQASYNLSSFGEGLFSDFAVPPPAHLTQAVRKRRAEYLASRVCVRHALTLMGVNDFILENDADRSPVWPAGIVGSLSHTDSSVRLLVAPSASGKLLGIDCEHVIEEYTAKKMQDMIVSAQELKVLQQSRWPYGLALTLAFSLKESLYKALYPQIRQFMDFNAAEITTCDEEAGLMVIRLARHYSTDFPAGRLFTGHVQIQQNQVLSWIIAPQR
ncbi:4'-phosphopantetheinyl transferase family protein [Erwinia mallotivora]|uniref:Enterobactin synthase component D n=1 Tax=Erwinia mallotivora TaxID=69222 RepID=A0A014M008_9GAMM|nr:4'-phosphopantetheinyl transferase superfamily protein [Erwinia mallotivora]EXU75156.1 4'-phosphopantetheinyl transferase [Erwinia mallotivora]